MAKKTSSETNPAYMQYFALNQTFTPLLIGIQTGWQIQLQTYTASETFQTKYCCAVVFQMSHRCNCFALTRTACNMKESSANAKYQIIQFLSQNQKITGLYRTCLIVVESISVPTRNI
ncbi:Hypothetical_protein [Hexamita inflata]|nr:Hypothetical protein HINF_LOCUS56416 [Hexamita inflata]CAI9968774.1 Hypothetical protein HINF_LOCUS56419 [Hexamita inflata]